VCIHSDLSHRQRQRQTQHKHRLSYVPPHTTILTLTKTMPLLHFFLLFADIPLTLPLTDPPTKDHNYIKPTDEVRPRCGIAYCEGCYNRYNNDKIPCIAKNRTIGIPRLLMQRKYQYQYQYQYQY
jgi:hypothetical protein